MLEAILHQLTIRDETQTTEDISELRRQIDVIDENLLEMLDKRMRISREIGIYKKEHNQPILQTERYDKILKERTQTAMAMGLNPEFIREIVTKIHEESVQQQMNI